MTPDQMVAAIFRNLEAKTGRTGDDWIALVRSKGPGVRKEAIAWLKREHGLGHVTASQIVRKALQPADHRPATTQELLDAHYAGPKAALRPLYERLAAAVEELGGDIDVQVKKGYVAFARGAQFAVVQASTRDRLDVGLRLKGKPAAGPRLRPAGSLGSDAINYKVSLGTAADVDRELIAWLGAAYRERAKA